jgi:hypothetical protein
MAAAVSSQACHLAGSGATWEKGLDGMFCMSWTVWVSRNGCEEILAPPASISCNRPWNPLDALTCIAGQVGREAPD